MRRVLVLVLLAMACAAVASSAAPVQAQDWCPSSDCPAVPRGAPSFPCHAVQIKADWDTMTYHAPTQASYAAVGTGYASDVWCFSQLQDALDYGFQRAYR